MRTCCATRRSTLSARRRSAACGALAGPSARLREDQWTAIQALARDRRRALVVQRTGWGKSAVYFVTTALLRARDMGPTIIISPLLALMRNQIEAAARAGLQARTVNSANMADWDEIYAEIAAGSVDLLLVSPERLNNPGFRDLVLPKLAATAGMLVVDEAHCISDWGHDFRPDYRRLRTVLENLPPGVPVLATTATANARVTRDVAEQLASGADGEALVLRGPLDRESLCLGVVQLPAAQQRLAWLAEHVPALPGHGIIYTLTVRDTEQVGRPGCARGDSRSKPIRESRGGAPGGSWRRPCSTNRVKALVATTALGMGFDKPDLAFVIHYQAPGFRSSPITSRSAVRVGLCRGPRWSCCPDQRTGTSGPTSPRWRSRPSRWSGRRSARWTRRPGRCRPARWRPRST